MYKLLLFSAINLLLIVTCSGYDNEYIEKKIVWANTELTARLLYNKILNSPGKSTAVAALPILAIIAQAALHAEGDKYKELTRWLYLDKKEVIKYGFSSTMRNYMNETGVSLTYSIFGDEHDRLSWHFEQNFKDLCDADIEYINYSKTCDASHLINTWFKAQYDKPTENIIDSDYFLNRGRGLLFGTHLYALTSWDHPFNPKGLVGIDFHKSVHEVQSLVGLYGNAFAKYADLPSLNAKMLMLRGKEESVQNSILYLYPNDPTELTHVLYRMQDPAVFYDAFSQMRDCCLKLHVTIGQAHVTNKYTTHISELNLNLTGLKGVFKDEFESAYVHSILQVLHLIADKEVRDGPIDTEVCPEEGLPFVKFNHPFAYFVLDKYITPTYAGLFYGY